MDPRVALLQERARIFEELQDLESQGGLAWARRGKIAANRENLRKIDEMLEAYAPKQMDRATPIPPEPLVWLGTVVEFAEYIFQPLEQHKICPKSKRDYVRQVARNYVDKDGEPFNERSLIESHRNKSDFQAGRKFKQ
jgi:hypothetical protein